MLNYKHIQFFVLLLFSIHLRLVGNTGCFIWLLATHSHSAHAFPLSLSPSHFGHSPLDRRRTVCCAHTFTLQPVVGWFNSVGMLWVAKKLAGLAGRLERHLCDLAFYSCNNKARAASTDFILLALCWPATNANPSFRVVVKVLSAVCLSKYYYMIRIASFFNELLVIWNLCGVLALPFPLSLSFSYSFLSRVYLRFRSPILLVVLGRLPYNCSMEQPKSWARIRAAPLGALVHNVAGLMGAYLPKKNK